MNQVIIVKKTRSEHRLLDIATLSLEAMQMVANVTGEKVKSRVE
jgi:hypothetical protein